MKVGTYKPWQVARGKLELDMTVMHGTRLSFFELHPTSLRADHNSNEQHRIQRYFVTEPKQRMFPRSSSTESVCMLH